MTKYDPDVVLAILRTKDWFVKKASATNETSLLNQLIHDYLHEGFVAYTIEKTGQIYDPSLDPFNPTILTEFFEKEI